MGEEPTQAILTVVMPTHNRARYAVHAIRSILEIDSRELELVVHDTSEDEQLEQFARGISDPRLRYIRCREPLSMTENHNRAMELAAGEYVCLIGDDDSILPEAIDVARWALKHGVAAVSPEIVANYAWPDFRSRHFGAGHAGRLYLRRRFGAIEWRNSAEDLSVALRSAALGTKGLPKIYHGIVSKAVLHRIRDRFGAYFFGISPDVSGAVGIAAVTETYVRIDYPLTLPGASAGSNTGRSATNTAKGSVEEDPHTRRFRQLVWPDALPRFVSSETVYAHAVYQTLEASAPALLDIYNLPRLYAVCLLRSPGYWPAVFRAAGRYVSHRRKRIVTLVAEVLVQFLLVALQDGWRLMRRALRPSAAGGRLFRGGIGDVAACEARLRELLREADPFPPLLQLLDRLGIAPGSERSA